MIAGSKTVAEAQAQEVGLVLDREQVALFAPLGWSGREAEASSQLSVGEAAALAARVSWRKRT